MPPRKIKEKDVEKAAESQALQELRLIFFGKKRPRGVKNTCRSPTGPRRNEVARIEDSPVARPDGGPPLFLFPGSRPREDPRGDSRGLARLARRQPRSRVADVLSPGGALDLDPASGRARPGVAGLRGNGHRLRGEQPAR